MLWRIFCSKQMKFLQFPNAKISFFQQNFPNTMYIDDWHQT
jgi:hypothetical protein